MATIVAFGRVDGKVTYQYGPKSFDKDWGGVFNGLRAIDLLTRIPKLSPPISGRGSNPHIREAGDAAQAAARTKLLQDFEALAQDIENILITKETAHVFLPNELATEFLPLSSGPKASAEMLADRLTSLDLNTWGVLRQICLAMSGLTDRKPDGGERLSMTIAISV